MKKFKSIFIICQSIFALIIFCACTREDLIQDISGKQSVETIVRLSEAGIPAKRTKTKNLPEARYSLKVASSDYHQAVAILHELGLPKTDSDTFDVLTKSKGFVANPREISAARLDAALAREVERLISILPAVVEVRAIVRSNLISKSQISSSKDPTASIIVRHLASVEHPLLSKKEIKSIVTKAVPGLLDSEVSVKLAAINLQKFPSKTELPLTASILPGYQEFWRDSTGTSPDNPLTPILIILGLVGISTFCLGFAGGKSHKGSRKSSQIDAISLNSRNKSRAIASDQPKLEP